MNNLMKYFRILLIHLLFYASIIPLNAQSDAPEGIYYQAVARDTQGNELVLQTLSIQVSIKENSTIIYTENHSTTADEFGLFELVIGNGNVLSATTFDEINWQADQYFLVISLDSGGGFIEISETQLLSVPFSLYSTTALNVINDNVIDADSDPENELVTDFMIAADSLRLIESGEEFSIALTDLVDDNDWIQGEDSTMHNSLGSNRVGIEEENPTSTLSVGGTISLGMVTYAPESNIDVLATEDASVILCDVTDAQMTVILPDATLCRGRVYIIKKFAQNNGNSAANVVTIEAQPGQNIDSSTEPEQLDGLSFAEISLISDGTNWFIIARSSFS